MTGAHSPSAAATNGTLYAALDKYGWRQGREHHLREALLRARKAPRMSDVTSPRPNVQNDSGRPPSSFILSHIPNKKKHQMRTARVTAQPLLHPTRLCVLVAPKMMLLMHWYLPKLNPPRRPTSLGPSVHL